LGGPVDKVESYHTLTMKTLMPLGRALDNHMAGMLRGDGTNEAEK
jgi:hypothetical protein